MREDVGVLKYKIRGRQVALMMDERSLETEIRLVQRSQPGPKDNRSNPEYQKQMRLGVLKAAQKALEK